MSHDEHPQQRPLAQDLTAEDHVLQAEYCLDERDFTVAPTNTELILESIAHALMALGWQSVDRSRTAASISRSS